ncbi:hypothetical protein G7068_08290 [Leucobacter viscericola]|uniref:Uncharacterized protein n=1 Tax=Leucobacter viscericola TaxID=2714935 RepID=A0A6G7XF23_9MICO|nr:hypothetical protein [Leucobacter viscericola]QIK63194.1 hypothetical protein G7068_08290 [Leucobacter viscericola]
MGFYVPHVINGSKHSARLFRRTLQKENGPGSGVDQPGDLKVLPLNQPGTGFRVMPGGGIAQSRDTDGSRRESYGPILDGELTVTDVPGTGSQTTRRDLIILEITDPEMESVTYLEPVTPESWQDGDSFCRITVIPNVDALVPQEQRPVTSLNQIKSGAYANVTGITLAAIDWPKSTATITADMITDLRALQNPRRESIARTMSLQEIGGLEGRQHITSTTAYPAGGTFPTQGNLYQGFLLDIPEWATHWNVQMEWMGLGNYGGKGNGWGYFWIQCGQTVDPDVWRSRVRGWDTLENVTTFIDIAVSQEGRIPEKLIGTSKRFFPRAVRMSGVLECTPAIVWSSQLKLTVDFEQRIV